MSRLLFCVGLLAALVLLGRSPLPGAFANGEPSRPDEARTAQTVLPDFASTMVRPTKRRPRLFLDARGARSLAEHVRVDSAAWRRVRARCEERAHRDAPAGYQAFEWADAIASLALCYHATREEDYGRAAVKYLKALTEDRLKIGDGLGGRDVVMHDSGYGIRTFGAFSAIGYDLLREAPGMDGSLRGRIFDRLGVWLDWYEAKGYLRQEPIANYFWGYLTALTFAGIATYGEHPSAARWLERSRELLSDAVVPTFATDLRGGAWPEGFQYGEYVTAEVSLLVRGLETATGIQLARSFPWLGETVDYHLHALIPGERAVYGGGTWQQRPSKPSAVGLSGVVVALDHVDERHAAEARWLLRNALPPLEREGAWLSLLGPAPSARAEDPRPRQKPSYHAEGPGLSFMRSDWSPRAVWGSFQAGPFLTPDHQDKDQGHFEIWRAGDGLIVDSAGVEGSATINHNTLLIDDAGRHLTYSPNQGVWGKDVATTHFEDRDGVVVVRGDIGDAYAPACVRDGCKERSVESLTRTMVFVRPSLFFIDDQIVLEQSGYGSTWVAHTTTRPTVHKDGVAARVGESRVDVQSLLPEGAKISVYREPTPSGPPPHRLNQPNGDVFRTEIVSPRGDRRRRFVTWMVAGDARVPARDAERIEGDGLVGGIGEVDGATYAVLILRDGARHGEAVLPASAASIVIAGLAAGTRYDVAVTTSPACSITLDESDKGLLSGTGGFLRVAGCPPRNVEVRKTR